MVVSHCLASIPGNRARRLTLVVAITTEFPACPKVAAIPVRMGIGIEGTISGQVGDVANHFLHEPHESQVESFG
jgi:hypothetical protein